MNTAISGICSLSVSTSKVQGLDMGSLLDIKFRNSLNSLLDVIKTAHLCHLDCIGEVVWFDCWQQLVQILHLSGTLWMVFTQFFSYLQALSSYWPEFHRLEAQEAVFGKLLRYSGGLLVVFSWSGDLLLVSWWSGGGRLAEVGRGLEVWSCPASWEPGKPGHRHRGRFPLLALHII